MIFRELCSFVTDGVKDSFSEYFRSRGIDIGTDLSVSVKLIITPQEVFDRFTLSPEQQQQIQTKNQWVITVYRDHYTYNHGYTRETNVKVYNIDGNTDFHHLVTLKEPTFFHNDLQSVGISYENENKEWQKYYNATIVVPIRYLSPDSNNYRCYGLLAVDSPNKHKIKNLFNDNECKYILGHAADLLATFFLLLELIDYKISQVAAIANPAPEVP